MTRERRKRIEQEIRLATRLAEVPWWRAPGKDYRCALARTLPSRGMPSTLEPEHIEFIGKISGLVGRAARDERGGFLVLARALVPPGKIRPEHSFATLARDLGITERHAKRLYREALDDIAEHIDRESRIA